MKTAMIIPGILFLFVTLQSCVKNNEEDLYPVEPGDCDTTEVSYQQSIWPIINTNCTGCHSGSAPSGNLLLENYDDVASIAASGALVGVTQPLAGFSQMPKGGELSDCDKSLIKSWVDQNYPNN